MSSDSGAALSKYSRLVATAHKNWQVCSLNNLLKMAFQERGWSFTPEKYPPHFLSCGGEEKNSSVTPCVGNRARLIDGPGIGMRIGALWT